MRMAVLSLMALGLVLAVFSVATLPACGEEECLAYNENCSRDYKIAEYGTEDIDCCEGTCQEGTLNPDVLICRN